MVLMIYVLVFVNLIDGHNLQYYQIGGSFANQVECNKERAKASALLTKSGTGLFCLEVSRD
jgi:hypothetical protein